MGGITRGRKLWIWTSISTNSNKSTSPISSNQAYQGSRSCQELPAGKTLPQARGKPKAPIHYGMELEVVFITYKSVLLFRHKIKLLMITKLDRSLQAFLIMQPRLVIGELRRFKTNRGMREIWGHIIIIPNRMSRTLRICSRLRLQVMVDQQQDPWHLVMSGSGNSQLTALLQSPSPISLAHMRSKTNMPKTRIQIMG